MFSKKQLRALIIPLIIEQFLAMAVGAADTMMVSSCGEAAVSAVSLVDSVNALLINIFSALATGGAVVSSQYIGSQEPEQARTAAKQLIYSMFFLSFLVMGFSLVFRKPLLTGIFGNVEKSVMDNALVYFWLSALSYPFLALYNGGAALFRAMGNSRVSMVVSFLMNLLNITGNAILIYGFQMGVAGAAVSSLIARAAAAVFVMALLRNRQNIIYIRELFHVRLNFSMIRSILRIGIPNGLENGIFQIGKILISSLIASFGTVSTAAAAIANTISGVVVIPCSAIGIAMITVTGQCVGAGDYKEVRHYTNLLMKFSVGSLCVINTITIIFIHDIVGIFHLSPETAALAAKLVIIHSAMGIPFHAGSFTLPNALRAAGDARYTMMISIISMWTFRIGFSFLLGQFFHMGVIGAWIAMTIDWIFRTVMFMWRYHGHKWENKKII